MNQSAEVQALGPDSGGRWLVATRRSRHVWDLDRRTYARLPGHGSQSFDHDCIEHPITRVKVYPEVGSCSIVWFEDPHDEFVEQWRVSSTIRSITQLDPGGEPLDTP
jgi:hypothetical protein